MKKYGATVIYLIGVIAVLVTVGLSAYSAFSEPAYQGATTKQERVAEQYLLGAVSFEECAEEFDEPKALEFMRREALKAQKYVSLERLQEMYPYVKDNFDNDWDTLSTEEQEAVCTMLVMKAVFQ